jgi:hypothetical protein
MGGTLLHRPSTQRGRQWPDKAARAHQTQSDPAGPKQAREALATLLRCAGRRAVYLGPFQLVASTIQKPSSGRTQPTQARLGP